MEKKTLKEYALEYLEKGKSIIPVQRNKKPYLSSWLPYQTQIPGKEEIEQWWTQWPEANIGLLTGRINGITVVDVEKEGSTEGLPPTTTVRTGGGGWHFYYKYADIGNKTRIRPFTDIRGDGGYVIVPPSVHESGKTYEWISNQELADFPVEILPKEIHTPSPLRLSEYVGLDAGTRNDSLHRLACSLLNVAPEFEAWETLKKINETSHPPLHEHELKVLFESAARFVSTHPKTSSFSKERLESNITGNQYLPVKLDTLTTETLDIQWIWHGYLARGFLTLVSALWKAGKTTFISHLIKSLEKENSFVGKSTQPATVLMVSEEGKGLWARRRDEFNISTSCWILCRPIKQKLRYREWVEFLEQMSTFCIENKIDVFILDTLSSFWNVDNENDAAVVQAALLPINHLLEKNIAVMLIHHFRKSGGEEALASRGSGAIGSYADILVEFTRLHGDQKTKERVLRTYSRFEETPEETVIELTNEGYEVRGSKKDVLAEQKFSQIITILMGFPEGATAQELFEEWPDERRPSERTLQRHLKTLSYEKRVFQEGEKIIGKKKTPIWKITN